MEPLKIQDHTTIMKFVIANREKLSEHLQRQAINDESSGSDFLKALLTFDDLEPQTRGILEQAVTIHSIYEGIEIQLPANIQEKLNAIIDQLSATNTATELLALLRTLRGQYPEEPFKACFEGAISILEDGMGVIYND